MVSESIAGSKLPIRTLLVLLVLTCLVPALLGTSALVFWNYAIARDQRERDTVQMARALVQAVDAQITQGESLALALTTSDTLMRRDFAAFHQRALLLLSGTSFIQSVLIYDHKGAPLVNTRLPYGQTLPQRNNREQILGVVESGRPIKPVVITSPLTHLPVISIAVPVKSGTSVEYVLVMGIAPDVFSNILTAQNLPSNWVAAVVDDSGTIAARTLSPEIFVGQKAKTALLQSLKKAPEGSLKNTTREGIQTVTAYSRSPVSNWSVAIAVPVNDLESGLIRTTWLLGLGATGLMLLGGLFAWFLGKRISRSVVALVAPSRSLLAGEPVIAPSVFFREAEDVATALVKGAELLAQRTTERELASKELGKAEAANLEKKRFMSTISHELRTPMHTMLGNLSLLRKAHSQSLDPYLQVAEKGGVQLLKLIDELLDFNIEGLRNDALQLDWTDLSYLRTMLLHFGSTAAAVADNSFEIDIAANVPLRLMVDERRLLQVLKNLVGNACKYTKGGEVSLRIECLTSAVDRGDQSRQTLRFSVQDTGRGIEPHDSPYIFEPLYRSASATDQPGVGLGLAIASQWVRNMGDDIVVTSEAGRGSIFQFDLELECSDAANGEDDVVLSTETSPQVRHTDALPAPPAIELLRIEELVNMGRLFQVVTWARELAKDERYAATAQKVIELAEAADLPALQRLLAQWQLQAP